MSRKVVLTPTAEADLDAILHFIALDHLPAAFRASLRPAADR